MSIPEHTTIVQELRKGNAVTYFTVGRSMFPLLTTRKTHVVIAPVSQLQKNDILLYLRKNGKLVLHRCIRLDSETCYIRGDNTYSLEPVSKEQILGVVTHIYRKGRQFPVSSRLYRAYVRIWNALYPLRLPAWKVRRAILSLFSKQGSTGYENEP